MLHDNPAASLHAILERGIQEKHDQACHAVWRNILEVTDADQGGLVGKLALVMDLPRRTLVLVQASFPKQLKAAEVWVGPIESAFMNQQLAGTWGTFAGQIHPFCIAQLSLTAELIQTRLNAKFIDEQELHKIMEGISGLLGEIDSSTVDIDLKIYLGRELTELQQAVRNYRFTGAQPIMKQTEAMLGHSLLDPKYSRFLSSHDLGARLLENLGAMANLLTVAVSLPQLTQSLGSLLLK